MKRGTDRCACGQEKAQRAKVCRACFNAQPRSLRMVRLWSSPACACINVGIPSPWHCRCGRWKPSAARVCEVCVRQQKGVAA